MNKVLITSFLVLFGVSASAYAIVGGNPDCSDTPDGRECGHPSAGFFALTLPTGPDTDVAAPYCSAVAVYKSPSVLVVLTAGHCPLFGDQAQITFAEKAWQTTPLIEYLIANKIPFSYSMIFDGTFQADPPTYVKIDKLYVHPETESKIAADIAVIVINDPAKLAQINSLWPKMVPSDLPLVGYLDTINKSELYRGRFEVVGNGLNWETLKGAAPALSYPIVSEGNRLVATIKLKNITAEGVIDLNTNPNFYDNGDGGMSLGDSGGSIYWGNQLVGLPASHFFPLTGGGPRLDTPLANGFICAVINAVKASGDPLPAACGS